MEDAVILQQLLDRDENAVNAVREKYGAMLQRIARNILADPRDAQECVNDTYHALWNAIPPARPDSLGAYAQRVCRNICLNRLRSLTADKRGAYTLSLEELANYLPGQDPRNTVSSRAVGQAINSFLAEESRENRYIFVQRYWYGAQVREIAQTLGLREKTVSARLRRLRDRLRTFLSKEGFYYESD